MTKLNQILALEADAKRHAASAVEHANRTLGTPALLAGLSRTYQPKDETGDRLPPESTRVQVKGEDIIGTLTTELARLFDLTATKDYANTEAKANVEVDGKTLVTGAPATYLLFLEKQLAELEAFIRRLPTLDPSEKWGHDEAQGLWATESVQTVRSKKVPRSHVAYEATKEHPAQVSVYTEDVPEGQWTLIKYSGAFPAPRVRTLLDRVRTLQAAVKTAREEANMHQVTDQRVGEELLGYLFG